MKIAQLHPYPPELQGQIPVLPGGIAQGGSETSSYRYAYKLSEMGHQVTYFVAKYPGISVNHLDLNKNFRIVYYKTIFKNVGPAFSFRLFFDLLRGDYDVIQSHQIPTNFSLIGGIAAKIKRKPFIITFHGRLPFNFIDSFVGTVASKLSVAVTVQNQYAQDEIKSFVPHNKIKIIPHGIDTAIFNKVEPSKSTLKKYKSKNEKIILFVGRHVPQKGIDFLIDSFSGLHGRIPNAKLIIAGDGPHRKEYETRAKTSGAGENILFVGPVDQMELPQLYSIADVFVLPSTYHNSDGTKITKACENFGLVLAEAMSSEVPIVASRVGGIPLWIDDLKTGRLVAERDVDGLQATLEEVILDTESRNVGIVKNAKKLIDTNYSWEAVIRQFEPFFEAKV